MTSSSSIRIRLGLFLALLTGCATVGACQSKEERLIPPPVVHTPLEIDPTAPPEAEGWWHNGRRLLRLSPDASYALWSGDNRYQVPDERGRWSQPSYAYVRLEPYDRRDTTARRLSFVRVGNEVALRLPDLEPFLPIDGPPPTPEDDLFGRWQGEAGILQLGPNLRYSFSSRTVTLDRPLILAGHDGQWRLDEGVLTLQPDTPGITPLRLPIRRDGEQTSLAFHGGDFHRE